VVFWRPSWFVLVLAVVAPVVAAAQAPPVDLPAASDAAAAAVVPFAFEGPPPPVAPDVMTRDASGRVTVRAVRLTAPIRLDGRLDEEVYGLVPPITDFIQQEPLEGAPATESTEAWLLFDDTSLYVSFRLWESDMESLVANEMRRDSNNIFQNDHIAFILDTFYDRRNSVEFAINPIGGRWDGQITNERNATADWNPIWDVKVGRFEQGWTVEAVIPFKSLRYRPGRAQIWGFNARRINRAKNETSFLTRVPRAAGQRALFQASLAATMVGLEVPSGAKNLDIKPYAVSGLATDLTTVPQISNRFSRQFGADVKYGVTQSLTADFTYNTDFAQVEADEQQVNLTRFSLFFPEKREFFLENQGLFGFGGAGTSASGDTPILFHSRRIGFDRGQVVPIEAGGRLTGRVGRFTLGVVNIQSDAEPSRDVRATNFSVVRVKRDILRRSSVGVMFTGRSVIEGATGSNQAYGVDGTFAFYDNLSINSYWATTRTGGVSGRDTSYRAQLEYAGDRYGVQIEQLNVGEHFRPDVGFVRRDDMRRSSAQLRFSPRPRSNRVIRRLSWTASGTYIENGQRRVETRNWRGEFGIELHNSDRFTASYGGVFELLEQPLRIIGLTVPAGEYEFADASVRFDFGRQRRLSGNVELERGTFYGGHKTTLTVGQGRFNPTPQLAIEPTYAGNWIELPDSRSRTHLLGSRVTYTVTPALFVSALLQYNTGTASTSSNARLRWEYRPGSELFVVYTEQRDTRATRFPDLVNRSLVVKVNRLFRI
jgi:hypothetical protein